MKYLNDTNSLEEKESGEVSFDKNGKHHSGKGKIYTKIVKTEKGFNYYITTYNNQIYDPIGISANREKYLDTKFKRVSKDTFDFYMIYLQTNNSIYLTRANRRFINE